METYYLLLLIGWTQQSITYNVLRQVVWNDNSKLFWNFLQELCKYAPGKTASSIKGSSLMVYPGYAVVLIFANAEKRWLKQNGHSLVVLRPVECAAETHGAINASAGEKESS